MTTTTDEVQALPLDGFLTVCGCCDWVGFFDEVGERHVGKSGCNYARCLPDHRGHPRGLDCHECKATSHLRRRKTATARRAAGGSDDDPTGAAVTGERERSGPVSRRVRRSYRSRPTEWMAPGSSAAVLLDSLRHTVERVYLTSRPDDLTGWALDADLPAGWEHSRAGHYLTGGTPVWRFLRDGKEVTVLLASGWFGEDVTEEEGPAAMALVAELIARAFGDWAVMLASPSATGRALWQGSIPFGSEGFPVLPVELQELVRATSGQGRIERLCPPSVELPDVHVYDARLAYGALCWGMPVGEVEHDQGDEYAGQVRGRYRCQVTVPAGWDHVGLLPFAEPGGGPWHWPSEPGRSWETWADGAELAIALAQGWKVEIRERLLWRTTGKPLDAWAGKLLDVREKIGARVAVGSVPERIGDLARSAVRAMLLHSIGSFIGAGHGRTRVSRELADVPDRPENLRVEGDRYVWHEPGRQAWPELAHPEWSALIWARARARLLDAPTGAKGVRAGMLQLPRQALVAARTDAVWTTEPADWPDDGKPGRYRLTATLPGPLPTGLGWAALIEAKGGR